MKEILLISEEDIKAALKLVYERMKIVIEPSSVVTLAAVLKNKKMFTGKKIGIIFTGGNVDLIKFSNGLNKFLQIVMFVKRLNNQLHKSQKLNLFGLLKFVYCYLKKIMRRLLLFLFVFSFNLVTAQNIATINLLPQYQ